MRFHAKNAQGVDGLRGLIERVLDRPSDRLPLKPVRDVQGQRGPFAGICLVLDLRQLQAPEGHEHRVSVLEAPLEFAATDLVAVRMADQVGIRAYGARKVKPDQMISVVRSDAYGRGSREWLACRCGQKGMKLYLPPFSDRFACASCHGLRRSRGNALRYNGENLRPWLLHWSQPRVGEWLEARAPG